MATREASQPWLRLLVAQRRIPAIPPTTQDSPRRPPNPQIPTTKFNRREIKKPLTRCPVFLSRSLRHFYPPRKPDDGQGLPHRFTRTTRTKSWRANGRGEVVVQQDPRSLSDELRSSVGSVLAGIARRLGGAVAASCERVGMTLLRCTKWWLEISRGFDIYCDRTMLQCSINELLICRATGIEEGE